MSWPSRNRRSPPNNQNGPHHKSSSNSDFSQSSHHCPHSPTRQQQFPVASTILRALLIALIFGSEVEGRTRRESQHHLPLSMDKEMFPPQDFDAEAPICLAEREPCGFYSFSLDGKAPLKWIKSWCRCSPKHECVYERTDMRMRVYRQTCVPMPKSEGGDDDERPAMTEEEQTQPKPLEENEDEERMAAVPSSQENQTLAPTPVPGHHRHHHHHHHRHSHGQRRHGRRANRRRVIRRLRAITLVD